MKLRTKLLLSFTLILILTSITNIYGLFQMEVLANLTTKMYNHPLQVTRAGLNANISIIKMHRHMKDVALANNQAEMEIAKSLVKQYEHEVYNQFMIAEKWILGDKGSELVAETIQIFRDWAPIRDEVITLMENDKKLEAATITKDKGAKHVALLDSKMELLNNYAASKAKGMYENSITTYSNIFTISIIILIIMMILSALLGWIISTGIVKSVRIINIIADKMVAGEITDIVNNSKDLNKIITLGDEVSDIGKAFAAIANSFKTIIDDISQVSQGLATGNLSVVSKATYQGDFSQIKTSLETTVLNQNYVIKDIIQVSQGLATKDLNVMPQAKYSGDFVAIEKALREAATELSKATIQNDSQNWIKTGQANLNEITRGEQDIVNLSKNIITFLCKYLGAKIGLFYILHENVEHPYLQIISSYAYVDNDKRPKKYLIGEGLVGQTALERKPLYLEQTTEECPNVVRSTLSNTIANHISILPCLYENSVKAILEIGNSKKLSAIQRDFLEQVLPNISIAINTSDSRDKMQELLDKSQQQAGELQSQQEELQKNNEELQGQSEELQSQQEELRQSNEILEERTKELERQRIETQEKNQALEINRTEMEKTQVEMEKAQSAIILKAKELELASKYKSEFLANMSHELRTPLNSLLILSKLLTENTSGNLNEKQIEYAKTINSSGNDLLTLINDILDLSKVEAGKIEVQWENVSLKDLLVSIEQKFSPIANDKGIGFNFKIADNIPEFILTDSQRIKQVINNLLSNAFKFTSQGEVKLLVEYPTEIPLNIDKLKLGKTIAISVSDSGIGIPPDKQKSVFEAFQQADGSTSRSYGGTGLGLSISRQLARLLDGELTLASEPEKGSTFTLYLPDKAASVSEKEAISPPLSTETPLLTEKYQSPKDILQPDDRNDLSDTDNTILIIEDDRKFSNIVRDLACDKGFKCLLAEDGIVGLQLATKYKPNAIILDIGLPRLDGLTVMEKLKENSSTRHIPVHFMSATDQSLNARRMGAIGYLVKPVSIEKLREAFKKIEVFLTKTVKKLLIVADSEPKAIMDLVAAENLQIEVSINSDDACQKLLATTYDCVILDIELEQGTVSKLLEKMQQQKSKPCKIPIIIYSNRDLTKEEETLLLRCSGEIPIKSVVSIEDLVDEASLFLHQIEADLSVDKRKMLHMVHDKKTVIKHKKVLIVDDDERNIFALATILENRDADVVCGLNGKEALEALESNNDIAIILMDIMMPEMDGYEAIRKIREQPKYRNLPIIALTAKAMKDDKAKCIEAGANDYLTK
ncbi:MAG: response regulator, partial [Candidatus Marithrix sp.]|nr:response regulator [Candidatus Marithrix sp.]